MNNSNREDWYKLTITILFAIIGGLIWIWPDNYVSNTNCSDKPLVQQQ